MMKIFLLFWRGQIKIGSWQHTPFCRLLPVESFSVWVHGHRATIKILGRVVFFIVLFFYSFRCVSKRCVLMAEYSGAISLSRDMSHSSDDDDEEQSPGILVPFTGGSAGAGSSKVKVNFKGGSSTGGEGGSSAEAPRKPRGRPPGSKNKPKPPIVITRECESGMKPIVIEVAPGNDLFETVVQFARRRRVGITILHGFGTISNVTFRQPVPHAPTYSLHGPLCIIYISGWYLGCPTPATPATSRASFSVSVAGTQGQIYGGQVAGKVTASGPVTLIASTFTNPSVHRLPSDIEDTDEGKNNGGASTSGAGTSVAMSGAYSVIAAPLNTQMAPDVMHWTATPRPPY